MARRPGQAVVRTMIVGACLLLATACGAAREVEGSARDVASEDTAAATAPAEQDTGFPPSYDAATPKVDDDLANAADDDRPVERSLRPFVDEAVRDLSERAGVPPDQITVVLAQRVMWPDDSLGCPGRGGGGLGDPHQGTRVHLRVDGQVFRYHTGGAQEEPFLCDPAGVKSEEHADRIEP